MFGILGKKVGIAFFVFAIVFSFYYVDYMWLVYILAGFTLWYLLYISSYLIVNFIGLLYIRIRKENKEIKYLDSIYYLSKQKSGDYIKYKTLKGEYLGVVNGKRIRIPERLVELKKANKVPAGKVEIYNNIYKPTGILEEVFFRKFARKKIYIIYI